MSSYRQDFPKKPELDIWRLSSPSFRRMACCLEQEEAGFDFIPKLSPLLQEPWSAISQLGGRDILLCLYYFLLSHWQSKAHRDDFLVKEGCPGGGCAIMEIYLSVTFCSCNRTNLMHGNIHFPVSWITYFKPAEGFLGISCFQQWAFGIVHRDRTIFSWDWLCTLFQGCPTWEQHQCSWPL